MQGSRGVSTELLPGLKVLLLLPLLLLLLLLLLLSLLPPVSQLSLLLRWRLVWKV